MPDILRKVIEEPAKAPKLKPLARDQMAVVTPLGDLSIDKIKELLSFMPGEEVAQLLINAQLVVARSKN